MANSVLLLIIIVFFAGLCALAIIGLAAYLIIRKSNGVQQTPPKDLDSEQVDEITSTWSILNP